MANAGVEAARLLNRIYTGNSPEPLYDDGMVCEWVDREIQAFIREHGPLLEVIGRLEEESEKTVTCKVCNGVGKAWGADRNKPCAGCGGAGKVRIKGG